MLRLRTVTPTGPGGAGTTSSVSSSSSGAGGEGTGGSVTQPPLEPGNFKNPLVLLQRLQGAGGDHLHVDEVRYRTDAKHLYQCSYTFGVVDATNPQSMKYLSEGFKHTMPGDPRKPGCIHLAWDGNFVFTTHRGNIDNPAFLTAWDITDPKAPVQVPALQEPGVSYEGIDVANHALFVALHDEGLGVHPDRLAPNLDLPENTNPFDLGLVDVGSSKTAQIQVGNQGTAPLTLINNWTEGTAFTVEPRQVAIPAGGKALLSITYTPTAATAESSYLHLLSDDPAQPSRTAYLTGNRPGLGVGVALPETTVTLVDGTTQWSSTSAANKGSVMLIAYFATFCPS
ncbi:MAG: hypothetical protein ABI134_24595, partial [Byssovorax sp.]